MEYIPAWDCTSSKKPLCPLMFVDVAYGGYALFVWCVGAETSNVHRD